MSAVLLFITTGLAAADDSAVRPDSLLLNETVPLGDGFSSLTWPLYLGRPGEYFIEVILEDGGDASPASLEAVIQTTITRRDEVIVDRYNTVALGPARPMATLFWFTADREVPLRDEVAFTLAVEPSQATAARRLRIQVRLKPNLIPRF